MKKIKPEISKITPKRLIKTSRFMLRIRQPLFLSDAMRRYYTSKEEENEVLKLADEKLPGSSNLAKDKRVIFSHGKTKEVFLVSDELFKSYERIKPRHPYSLGFFFGEQTRTFNPSLSTASEYAKSFSSNKITITQKAEQHFLYGNNLEKQMLLSISPGLKKSSIVVVCNERGEALGLGVLTVNPEEAQPGKLFVRNIKNISAYLRNQFI